MKCIVDRIEGEIAVIELPEFSGHIEIPVKFLPEGISEGNVLKVNFEIDAGAEEARKEKVKNLRDKLLKR